MEMERLKQLIEKRKEKTRLQKDAELMSEFQVVERGGYIWLTLNGVAFVKFEDGRDVSDITDALKEIRKYAIEFARL